MESPTADEPVYVLSGWVYGHAADYRINPEHPPLWKRWADLPNQSQNLVVNFDSPLWQRMNSQLENQWDWTNLTLFRTPGNDTLGFFRRARGMMLLIGIALGATIAAWAWRIGGPGAAVLAAALFGLDPNFIAHAPLVVNDVALALAATGLLFAVWEAGRRLTIGTAAAVALLAALSPNIKAPGLVLPPIAAILLLGRALSSWPWVVFGRVLAGRGARLAAAGGVIVAMGLACVVLIWAAYGFRYAPSSDPSVKLNVPRLVALAAAGDYRADHPNRPATPQEKADWHPLFVRGVLLALRHRMLPQAYLAGLLFNYVNTRTNDSFLIGRFSQTGWWYYFPLAILFKTPLATLIAMAASVAIGVALWRRRARRGRATFAPPLVPKGRNEVGVVGEGVGDVLLNGQGKTPTPALPLSTGRGGKSEGQADSASAGTMGSPVAPSGWTFACLALPVVIFGISSITSHMNIGIRHVLTLYPFFFVAVSMAGAAAWAMWRRGRWVIVALVAGLAAETVAGFPYYLSFFNAACGGWRGGISLLSDSNLDWGQDLLRLRDWQRAHPGPLYLAYSGSDDPRHFGIQYQPMVVDFPDNPRVIFPSQPGYIAVSVGALQGAMFQNYPALAKAFEQFRQTEPTDIVGTTIYVFKYQ